MRLNALDALNENERLFEEFGVINELGSNDGGLGAADFSFDFGNFGDKPVVGDWDGDGIDEIGLHRESSGLFHFRNTLSTGNADDRFFFGNPGGRFVAGEWGIVDGKDTPARCSDPAMPPSTSGTPTLTARPTNSSNGAVAIGCRWQGTSHCPSVTELLSTRGSALR